MEKLTALFDTHQVAEMLQVESKTLANSRSTGVGIGSIPFVKFGQNGAVRYRESDSLMTCLDCIALFGFQIK